MWIYLSVLSGLRLKHMHGYNTIIKFYPNLPKLLEISPLFGQLQISNLKENQPNKQIR